MNVLALLQPLARVGVGGRKLGVVVVAKSDAERIENVQQVLILFLHLVELLAKQVEVVAVLVSTFACIEIDCVFYHAALCRAHSFGEVGYK